MTFIITDRFSLTEYLFESVEDVVPILDRNNSFFYNHFVRFIGRGPEFFRFSPFNRDDRRKLERIQDNDTLVIFGYDYGLARYIRRKYPKLKNAYFYLWDPCYKIFYGRDENELRHHIGSFVGRCCKIGFAVYTFDEEDAIKFGLGFNKQLYVDRGVIPYEVCDNSFVFCGYEKGRMRYINLFKKLLEPIGFCNFTVVSNQTQEIPYEKYVEICSKSLAICDIVQINQSGLTMRALEGLFLKKKVITNNNSIIQSEIYHPNNFFVINEDTSTDEIQDFLCSPYIEMEPNLMKSYTIQEWVKRFTR